MTYKGRAPFQSAAFTETQRNFTTFDKSLTSGLSDVVIQSPGDFLYIDQASTGVVRVELNMRQGGSLAPITLAAGGSIECDFSSIKLNADVQLNKSVRIVIGNGARIKGGANVNASSMSVSVVDGGLVRTLNDQAFMGALGAPAVAGNYTHIQLWNPTTSTKRLYLESFSVSSTAAQLLGAGTSDTPLASTIGATGSGSKLVGATAPAGSLKYESRVANTYSKLFKYDYILSATTRDFSFKEPVVIAPATGFVLFCGTVNTAMYAGFEWFEQ